MDTWSVITSSIFVLTAWSFSIVRTYWILTSAQSKIKRNELVFNCQDPACQHALFDSKISLCLHYKEQHKITDFTLIQKIFEISGRSFKIKSPKRYKAPDTREIIDSDMELIISYVNRIKGNRLEKLISFSKEQKYDRFKAKFSKKSKTNYNSVTKMSFQNLFEEPILVKNSNYLLPRDITSIQELPDVSKTEEKDTRDAGSEDSRLTDRIKRFKTPTRRSLYPTKAGYNRTDQVALRKRSIYAAGVKADTSLNGKKKRVSQGNKSQQKLEDDVLLSSRPSLKMLFTNGQMLGNMVSK